MISIPVFLYIATFSVISDIPSSLSYAFIQRGELQVLRATKLIMIYYCKEIKVGAMIAY